METIRIALFPSRWQTVSEFQLPLPHSTELLRRLWTAAVGTAAAGTASLWRHHTAVRQSHSRSQNHSGTSFTDRLSAQCRISFQLGFPYPFCFSWEVSGFSPLENLPWSWRGPEEVLVGCDSIDLHFSSAALGPPSPTDPPFRTHFTLKPHRAGKGMARKTSQPEASACGSIFIPSLRQGGQAPQNRAQSLCSSGTKLKITDEDLSLMPACQKSEQISQKAGYWLFIIPYSGWLSGLP